MNVLLVVILFLVTGQTQNADAIYTIADLLLEQDRGVEKFAPKDPTDPGQQNAEKIFARCYKLVHTFIDSRHAPNPGFIGAAIHFSLLKSMEGRCGDDAVNSDGKKHKINIRRFQFAILGGRTKSEADRMPIGRLDTNHFISDEQFKDWADYCTYPPLQDPLNYAEIKYHRRYGRDDVKHTATLVDSLYHTSLGTTVTALVFKFTNAAGEDDVNPYEPKELPLFKWYPLVSFTFHYPVDENYVNLLNKLFPHGAEGNRLYLDFIGEANFFTDRGGDYWTNKGLTKTNVVEFNTLDYLKDQRKTDCKAVDGRELRFANHNKEANEVYEGADKATFFSNMCDCPTFEPNDFYKPHLLNPHIFITEQKYHPDPNLRNCFTLQINGELEPQSPTFDYLWITLKYTQDTCGHYFGSSHPSFFNRLRPLRTRDFSDGSSDDKGFLKIIALDSKGLPFGKWSNDLPTIICESERKNYCKDKEEILNMINNGKPTPCVKPDGYDKYDTSTDRSQEEHNEANLKYFTGEGDVPILANTKHGRAWNVKFTPTYLNSKLLKTIQFISEIALTKIVAGDSDRRALIYPEIISVRSPVYSLEISNSRIISKPKPASGSEANDIYINRDLYKEPCRNLTNGPPAPPPPPTTTTVTTTVPTTVTTTTVPTTVTTTTVPTTVTTTTVPTTVTTTTVPTTVTTVSTLPQPLAYDFYLCRHFHEEIPLSNRYVAFDSVASIDEKYRNCFRLEAYPGRKENSLHIEYLQWNNFNSYPDIPNYCRGLYGVEIAVQAVNEYGYPVGTFEVYTGLGNQANEKCVGGREIPPRYGTITKNYQCFFIRGKSRKYSDKVTKADETPHIFGYKVIDPTDKENVGGISLLWRYQPQKAFSGPSPTTIEIYAEVYIPADIDPQGPSVVVLRSSKYKFNYTGINDKHDASRNCKDSSKNIWFEKDTGEQNVEIQDFMLECKSSPLSCGLSLTEPLVPPPPPIPHIFGGDPTSAPVIGIGGGTKEVERKYGNLDWYSGCDVSKGCIAPPIENDQAENNECFSAEKQNCKMLVTFGDNPMDDEEIDVNSEIIMEMYNPTAYKWMALGISEDKKMPSSFAIQCVSESVVTLYPSFNIPGRYDNKRLADDEMDSVPVRLLKSDKQGSKLYCRFAIKKRLTVHKVGETKLDHTFDLLNKPYFLLYAWGVSAVDGKNGNLKSHKPQKDRRTSSKKIALAARFSPDASQKVLLRYHATFMLTGILFFLTLGLFTGRFFKESYVTVKFLGKPLWLIAHIIFTTIALGLMLTGLAMEIIGHQGWTGLTPANFHSYSGVVVFGLIVVVYGVGWFLKPTKYGHRNWASAAHAFIGNFVYCLSIVVMVNSEKVSFSGMPCTIKFIVGTYASTVLILFGAFSYHYCWVDWVMGLTGRGVNIFLPIGVAVPALARNYVNRRIRRRRSHGIDILLDPNDDENPVEAPGKWMRMWILGLTALLGFCYTFWAVFLLWRNSSGLRDCYTTREIFEFSKNA